MLDDSQFQADIHHWLERLVYKTATSHTLHSSGFISSHGSGPLSRWQSCCMLEDQESTCICCAIFCAVPLGWGSGRHPSFRLVSIIFIFVMLLLCVQMSRFFFPIIVSDSGQIQPLWHTTLYASFSHPNVTCQSPCRVSGPHETLWEPKLRSFWTSVWQLDLSRWRWRGGRCWESMMHFVEINLHSLPHLKMKIYLRVMHERSNLNHLVLYMVIFLVP